MKNDTKSNQMREQATDQARERAVLELRQHCTEENLWNCIVVFQDYPFFTVSGLPFTYTLKRGRNGEFTKELFVDRMANSKSLAWSSIRIAFERAKEQDEVIDRPKALGDVRGVSYVYSLLWRFGLIAVPKESEEKLSGRLSRAMNETECQMKLSIR